MLITRKFVMLNFPKTGSAFARDTLKRLHQGNRVRRGLERFGLARPRLQEELMMPYYFNPVQQAANGRLNSEHGTYQQIPKEHRHKPVFTVVRDPLRRLVSLYEFRSWVQHPFPSTDRLKQWFPHFPDLSFDEYCKMNQELALPFAQPEGMQVAIGPLTTQFIRFYARDPLKTILSLREDTDLRRDQDLHFPQIRFLHTEHLNQELHDLLLEHGYGRDKLAFILDKPKMNTTKRSRTNYLTPDLVARLHHSERFFYQLFPEYLDPAR